MTGNIPPGVSRVNLPDDASAPTVTVHALTDRTAQRQRRGRRPGVGGRHRRRQPLLRPRLRR
ncbi:MAG: hypothetical protein KDB12_15315, partial [Ilumatobacter sp.]|nr:hypothetical protein [Ilumatobacter sp.]